MLLQFIKFQLQSELKLASRKRNRCYGTFIHFNNLGRQLWQMDWHPYETPAARVDLLAEMQLNIFCSGRSGEFIESKARAGSGRGLHYKVSMA